MEASFLICVDLWCGALGLASALLSVHFPDVSMLEILDTLKDIGRGTNQSVDDIDPGLTTGLLNVTLYPWPLPAISVSGT